MRSGFTGAITDAGVVAPTLGLHVDVELELVAVGVLDVERVRHGVVGRADQLHAGRLEVADGVAQLVVGRADLESEVVEADTATARYRSRVGADLDQQQLVMGSPAPEGRRPGERAGQLGEAEDVAVEVPGRLEVADVQDCVAEFVSSHGPMIVAVSTVVERTSPVTWCA